MIVGRQWLSCIGLIIGLVGFLAACGPRRGGAETGEVEVMLVNGEGLQVPGIDVMLDGTERRAKSDDAGKATFLKVPAGTYDVSVARTDEVKGRDGKPMPVEVKLEKVTVVVVVSGGKITIKITIEITIDVAPAPHCDATPWCGIVGGKLPDGTLRVVSGGGRSPADVPCACQLTGTLHAAGGACPTRTTQNNAAAGVYTVTSTTCLGDNPDHCALPAKATTCTIRL